MPVVWSKSSLILLGERLVTTFNGKLPSDSLLSEDSFFQIVEDLIKDDDGLTYLLSKLAFLLVGKVGFFVEPGFCRSL